MTEKDKAEAYVRGKIPELMELSFGCRVKVKNQDVYYTAIGKPYHNTNWNFVKVAEYKDVDNGLNVLGLEIIGHPIELQHWLRVLLAREIPKNEYKETVFIKRDGTFTVGWVDDIKQESGVYAVKFNLTTGQPATEADYQGFNEIVGN